ncbi:uncharacterized protein B0T15DRAFT_287670 [Chaetomium strumarium]|uniref:Secreted protein n=1 Tax=Chaetomium strumarium TaxID=1170767 RepID=A0AAJ0GL56_9PEZI|nr:hypothetical protein B0T15DRAFT_287670 [Chaetomium strumarium]
MLFVMYISGLYPAVCMCAQSLGSPSVSLWTLFTLYPPSRMYVLSARLIASPTLISKPRSRLISQYSCVTDAQ